MNTPVEKPWIADVTYGVTEGGHKWAESEYDHGSAHYLDANFEEAFKIDDVSSVFHYEPIARLDRLKSNMTKEHNDEDKDFSGLLCDDDIANLTLAVYLPKLSEDHIMDTDVDFAKKVSELDFKFCDDELNFGNSRSAINYPKSSNEVVGVSELSDPLPKGLTSTCCEMHDVAGSICRHETLIEDGMCLSCSEDRMSIKCSIVIGTQNVHYANDEQYQQSDKGNQENQLMKAEDFSINHLSTNSSFGEKAATSRQKRSCHPPKKYAEGSPISKPQWGRPKKYLMSSSKDKDPDVMSQKQCHRKSSKRKTAKVSKGNLEQDSDDDYLPNASCFRSKKYNKLWTLDEVVKVVDGIAHFGQGQWTAIQKTFFSSSCRTPTDIRDKWRNLVKTNCGNLKSRRKDGHLRKGSLSLPNTIIERVMELAKAIPQCRSEHEG